jgi:hypothetical protein
MSAKQLRRRPRRGKASKAQGAASRRQQIRLSEKTASEIEDKFLMWQREHAGTVSNIKKHDIEYLPVVRPPKPVGEKLTMYKPYSMLVGYEIKPK